MGEGGRVYSVTYTWAGLYKFFVGNFFLWNRYRYISHTTKFMISFFVAFLDIKKFSEFLQQNQFSNFYIIGTRSRRPLIFQTINILSLKYQRYTPSGYKDIGKMKISVSGKNSIPLKDNY